jgi:uncharacterized membrane protein
MTRKTNFKDTDIRVVIGWVLRIGVIVSTAVVAFGGIVYLYRHGHEIADHSKFIVLPAFVQTHGIISGIINFRGRSIIQAGIILLIATPVLRVFFSAIGFMIEKDYLYVGISLLVLLIIFISMLSGHAG